MSDCVRAELNHELVLLGRNSVGFERVEALDIVSGPPAGVLDARDEVIIRGVESSTEQRRYRPTANFGIPMEVNA